tara:strand:- start:319 stop:432 length:114 start_codon:yes stop_codon:yes gene_type:complete
MFLHCQKNRLHRHLLLLVRKEKLTQKATAENEPNAFY